MATNEIMQLISTIGFPIAMCIVLMRYIQTTQKELITKLGEISLSIGVLCAQIDDKNGGKNAN